MGNKKLFFFLKFFCLFPVLSEATFTSFSKIKVIQKGRFLLFLLDNRRIRILIRESTVTNRSGSGTPKNIRSATLHHTFPRPNAAVIPYSLAAVRSEASATASCSASLFRMWTAARNLVRRQSDTRRPSRSDSTQAAAGAVRSSRTRTLQRGKLLMTARNMVRSKGVGPSTTVAWPGWKQPDIAVKVDTARLNTSRCKKCCEKCVLLYYPSTKFKSAFDAYWHGEGAAMLSCTELSIWEFPFLRGACWQGGNSIWYCMNGMPQKYTLDNIPYTTMLSILLSSLTSVSIFSVWCYSTVSISVVRSVVKLQKAEATR